jgi:hypothetical protein
MTLKFACASLGALMLMTSPVYAQNASDTAAAVAPAQAAPASSAPPAPSNDTVAPAIGAPPAGKGQIVFFRQSAFTGMAVWFRVRENGSELGKLSNGVYFVQTAEPGPHTFTAETENKNILRLEVDPGETYYVRGSLTMGLLVGEANIAPSDQATFEKALKHMRLAPPPAAVAAKAPAATAGS